MKVVGEPAEDVSDRPEDPDLGDSVAKLGILVIPATLVPETLYGLESYLSGLLDYMDN